MKLKTYPITLSQRFPGYHPRKGEPTGFKGKLFEGDKKHTIRGNYKFWKKRFDEIAAGRAKLSVREWLDKPYHSKQVILREYTSLKGIGIQKVDIDYFDYFAFISVDDRLMMPEKRNEIILNDGLNNFDFEDWFKKPLLEGVIIHFTDLRY